MQYTFISNSLQLLALPQLVINKLRKFVYRIFSSDQKAFTVSTFVFIIEMVLQFRYIWILCDNSLLFSNDS